jgi:hypothetical protein
MNCSEFQEALPDQVDGARGVALEAHLKTCPACSDLVSDLEAISEQSKLLSASEEPSPRVWQSIASQLRREGLIRDSQPERPFLVPTSRRPWRFSAWLVPVAAVLVFGFGFLVSRMVSLHGTGTQAISKLAQPVSPTVGDDSIDDKEVLAEVQKTAPMMEAAYEQNLKDVNAYIADAQRSVDANPSDDDAREYLMEAREQKSMLYEMALERSLP